MSNISLSCRTVIGNALLITVFLLPSCADNAPSIPEKTKQTEPYSKPVRMPPTNRKLGSSNGMAIDEVFQLQQAKSALIYDVRNPYFYRIDHIPGSINWPYTEYDAQVQQRDLEIQKALNDGKKIIIYCFNRGCPEARNVAKKLARRDYGIYVFSSGIDTWREAGLPLVTAAPSNL